MSLFEKLSVRTDILKSLYITSGIGSNKFCFPFRRCIVIRLTSLGSSSRLLSELKLSSLSSSPRSLSSSFFFILNRSFLYSLQLLLSSLCVPEAAIFPSLRTKMLSLSIIELSLCAIKITVVDLDISRMISLIAFSVLLSNADVASSKIKNFGPARIALVIAISCFSPPESFVPFIPTT